jgi:hypothetical protein
LQIISTYSTSFPSLSIRKVERFDWNGDCKEIYTSI